MENIITNLSKKKITRKVFKKLPHTPGVYIFWKKKTPTRWVPIYIGKSINLKSRLLSYLNINLGPKTSRLMSETESLSIIKVFSELESLLLEARLIRKFKPFYNIVAKDDKRPLYIVITKDEYPRIISSRKPIDKDCGGVFGPFPASGNVKIILKLIRRIFPYSDHIAVTGKLGKRGCIYSQIGLCNPCPSELQKLKDTNLKIKLTKQYKQNIKNIKKLLQGKFTIVQKNLEKQMKEKSKEKKYEEAAKLRDQLKVLEYITQPQIPTHEYLKNPNLESDIRTKELHDLKTILNKNNNILKNLTRIECFDVAHISGVNATASMVVAIDGQMEHSKYRHFKIKQTKTQSDFDSMVEVASRRFKNIKLWRKPDLIVVDGGLAQVKAFNEVFKVNKIPVVGIAKHPDRLIFTSGEKIRLTGSALRLTQRLRDEAHRFARRYHHLLMKKSLLSST